MSTSITKLITPLGPLQMFIGGKWTGSESGRTAFAYSPASREQIATVPEGTHKDAQAAIRAAQCAEETLGWMTPLERSRMCHKVADVIDSRKAEFARFLTLDQDQHSHSEAQWEAGPISHFFHQAAEDVVRLNGETLPSADPNKRAITLYQSRGTYGVIIPWNFPYIIPSEYPGSALAAGNPGVRVPTPSTKARMMAVTDRLPSPRVA